MNASEFSRLFPNKTRTDFYMLNVDEACSALKKYIATYGTAKVSRITDPELYWWVHKKKAQRSSSRYYVKENQEEIAKLDAAGFIWAKPRVPKKPAALLLIPKGELSQPKKGSDIIDLSSATLDLNDDPCSTEDKSEDILADKRENQKKSEEGERKIPRDNDDCDLPASKRSKKYDIRDPKIIECVRKWVIVILSGDYVEREGDPDGDDTYRIEKNKLFELFVADTRSPMADSTFGRILNHVCEGISPSDLKLKSSRKSAYRICLPNLRNRLGIQSKPNVDMPPQALDEQEAYEEASPEAPVDEILPDEEARVSIDTLDKRVRLQEKLQAMQRDALNIAKELISLSKEVGIAT